MSMKLSKKIACMAALAIGRHKGGFEAIVTNLEHTLADMRPCVVMAHSYLSDMLVIVSADVGALKQLNLLMSVVVMDNGETIVIQKDNFTVILKQKVNITKTGTVVKRTMTTRMKIKRKVHKITTPV